MKTDSVVVARLRAAGCVFAEEEAAVLASAAASPAELDALVARRAAGEPLEQVVGWAEFAGLRVLVDPGVFVPRRRSEFLVEVAVLLAGRPAAPSPASSWTCAAAPARSGSPSRPGCRVELHAADLDPAAVACARRNVSRPAGASARRPVRRAAGRAPGGRRADLQRAVRADRRYRVLAGRGARDEALMALNDETNSSQSSARRGRGRRLARAWWRAAVEGCGERRLGDGGRDGTGPDRAYRARSTRTTSALAPAVVAGVSAHGVS